jgi:hypothetical protein
MWDGSVIVVYALWGKVETRWNTPPDGSPDGHASVDRGDAVQILIFSTIDIEISIS